MERPLLEQCIALKKQKYHEDKGPGEDASYFDISCEIPNREHSVDNLSLSFYLMWNLHLWTFAKMNSQGLGKMCVGVGEVWEQAEV